MLKTKPVLAHRTQNLFSKHKPMTRNELSKDGDDVWFNLIENQNHHKMATYIDTKTINEIPSNNRSLTYFLWRL